MILTCTFDPVTRNEIAYIRKYMKDHQIRDIFVKVEGDGILSRKIREKLLKKAVQPYRHIHLCKEGDGMPMKGFTEEEEMIRKGRFYLAAYGIRKILCEQGYYFTEIMESMCTEERIIHSYGVADMAEDLAVYYGFDPKISYQMGLLHDITKRFSKEENEKIMRVYHPEWLDISEKVWHAFTAVTWVKQNMGLHDHRILNAMYHHTLGDGHSPYCHILYMADKLEINRTYECEKERKEAYKDLYKGAVFVRDSANRHIKNRREHEHIIRDSHSYTG